MVTFFIIGGCSTMDNNDGVKKISFPDQDFKSPIPLGSKALTDISSPLEGNSGSPQDLAAGFVTEGAKKEIIEKWINYYTQRDKERFIQHLKNGVKYRTLVESILKQYSLPLDLYYLGIIESGYNLRIKSRAKAVGPWQFMKGTAKRYGLQVNKYVDERRSIFKSTHAAAQYLKDLYEIFNDWELALAAYNAGEYKILKAIKKGKSREYDILTDKRLLPRETRNYLPKLLAVKTIERNLKSFGIDLFIEQLSSTSTATAPAPAPQDIASEADLMLNMSTYHFTYPVAVVDVVNLLAMNDVSFRELNPDINGQYINASEEKPFSIYLPSNKTPDLIARMAQNPLPQISNAVVKSSVAAFKDDDRPKRKRKKNSAFKYANNVNSKNVKTYLVKRGDSFFKIAAKLGISVQELKSLNGNKKRIYPNQRIGIPTSI